ncbi:uncharacterized protein [Phaseolus vulgaris]|uniref:uncharacterized protein isoform X1 n=2 Tax=Phaseolus vulgaris TaxID=3885 RepID=UPI0035C997B7
MQEGMRGIFQMELMKQLLFSRMLEYAVKMAVVSNFDNRLRKLLKDLNVLILFDAVIISSEVGYEKPDSRIFQAALDQVNVEASKALHIGDDEKADKLGANDVGIDCWLSESICYLNLCYQPLLSLLRIGIGGSDLQL